jgi:N-acetylglucosamine-6-phosphate deacetylase
MNLRVHGGVDLHGAPVEIAIADGRVVARASELPADAPLLDASGLMVAPGFLDLQVNGAGGVDVTAQPDRLGELGPLLAPHGVTGFLPTVITAAAAARDGALAALAALRQAPAAGAAPLGLHFEGPLLAPARKGAHPADLLCAPSAELVAGWSREAGVTMVTLAPELPGALELIAALRDRGVVVALGHTEASGAEIAAALAAGASCVTHLFNAMSSPSAREPGAAGVALGGDDLVAGVIADGHHLDPHLLRTAWRALGPDRFLAVSDTTAALGQPDGPIRLGEQEAFLADGVVRLADGTLAGSASSLADCLRVLRATTGCSPAEAVATATTTPARLIGDEHRGRLDAGCRGDLVLLDVADDRFDVVATVVAGEIVHDAVCVEA